MGLHVTQKCWVAGGHALQPNIAEIHEVAWQLACPNPPCNGSRAANFSSTQVEVHDSGCCQSSIMHIHAAKLPVQQSPVIAKASTNNLMKTTLIHIVLGMTAKNNMSHTQYTHVHVIYRQLLKTLST